MVGEGHPGSRRGGEPDGLAFQSVNLPRLWSRPVLTATQLARLTGLSRRQVEWWRRRGYLPPSPEAPDRFNGDELQRRLLATHNTIGLVLDVIALLPRRVEQERADNS